MTESVHGMWRVLGVVAWPSFMMAAAMEALVFAFADPQQLHTVSGATLAWSENAVYTTAFVLFWIIISGACLLTLVLARSSRRINGEGPVGLID